MNPPNSKYNSGGVPHGGMFVDIYRLSNPEDTTTGVKLGRYLVESCNPSASATVTKRPNVDGGKNGWFITEGDTEGQSVIQRNTAATPTVDNGDYFEAAIRVNAAFTAVIERFVIHTPDHAKDAGYRKQSVTVIVDQTAAVGGGTDDNNPA